MNDYKNLIVKNISKSVMEVTLNDPDRHNALSPEMIFDIDSCFERIDQNDNIKIIILTSRGKSFCAGGDLKWMKNQFNVDRETRIVEAKKLASMLNKLFYTNKVIIGKIQGNAFLSLNKKFNSKLNLENFDLNLFQLSSQDSKIDGILDLNIVFNDFYQVKNVESKISIQTSIKTI